MNTDTSPGTSSTEASVLLTPVDIPGADLKEPFQSHTVLALIWWLECRGVVAPSSWKKSQIVSRYLYCSKFICCHSLVLSHIVGICKCV